ncbi:SurA N-terminal domain-containing protein [Exiguobacterium sp. 17-1]|uniref:SurA N-terminal domain-containing protein n=1 Tax=Exiguobacterium sp. 17-1 TaxID=2931981 RepID=UPI001FFE6706|nr:SurA N-terminal domain-containing protein [Exiguobacterium sp. 17-1]MCK2159027.1 SurA N-terminal domain-containing protein [Exiguobacterium sp. 17-1]
MGTVNSKYLWMLIFILLLTNFLTGAYAFMGELPKVDSPKIVQDSIGGPLEEVVAKVGDEEITRADVYQVMKKDHERETIDRLIAEAVEKQSENGSKPTVERFD